MSKKSIYRVSFINDELYYEIYARSVCESEMFGFLEVGDFVFGENTAMVVDPSEEKLKVEFAGVKRTFIPVHAVIRVDEVEKEGVAKAVAAKGHSGKVSIFPGIPNKSED